MRPWQLLTQWPRVAPRTAEHIALWPANDQLTPILRDIRIAKSLTLPEWDTLIPQARCTWLLPRLALQLRELGLFETVPEAPRKHLESAELLAKRNALAVRWEINRIQAALQESGIPVILLKGAAYLMASLPPATGRLFADVDIMVPKATLNTVERALQRYGWNTTHLDPYDQRYYRMWMHELPPLKHARRHTVLDVHHTILPVTARLKPDPRKLLAAATPVEEQEELYVLAAPDMVLHSACHLFHDGEFEHGLRDLVDLDALLRHFQQQASFWKELLHRAEEINLLRPLYYALRYTRGVLGTPIPTEILEATERWAPPYLTRSLIDTFFLRALRPTHPSCEDSFSGVTRWALYMRSHYLRMPMHLLIPHLTRKAFRRNELQHVQQV